MNSKSNESNQLVDVQIAQQVALVWLNRPDTRNAMNPEFIEQITTCFQELGESNEIRAIVLAGRGSAFSAGGDLRWMKEAASYGYEQNLAGGQALAAMFDAIASCPKPVIARIHGAAFAGGMGLVAACDIAVASTDAKFCLTEVKLGLSASTISPYVVQAMGIRAARRYFLTAEVIDAAEAYRIGLVQELVSPEELDNTINSLLGNLLQAGPNALAASKKLLAYIADRELNSELRQYTAKHISDIRAGQEAQDGIKAFFDKQPAPWVPKSA